MTADEKWILYCNVEWKRPSSKRHDLLLALHSSSPILIKAWFLVTSVSMLNKTLKYYFSIKKKGYFRGFVQYSVCAVSSRQTFIHLHLFPRTMFSWWKSISIKYANWLHWFLISDWLNWLAEKWSDWGTRAENIQQQRVTS